MPLFDDLQALREVQAHDARILRARGALAALDAGARLAAEHRAAREEAEGLRNAANRAKIEQHDAEMRLQSIEAKAAQVQKTLFSGTVATPRELENLQKEAEMLHRQRGDAETHVLEAMETAGKQAASAEAAEAMMSAIADRYHTVRAAYKERHAALTEEIAAHERDRSHAASRVPDALLLHYDAVRLKKNGMGATSLEPDGTCGACHTRLNTGLADAVKEAATIQICEYCGRILIPAAP